MIKLEKQSDKIYDVWFNIKYLGQFVWDVDGYFHYKEDKTLLGYWDAYQLRAISDKLDEVNKPFDNRVKEYFEKEELKRIVDLANENNIRLF